jgi:hypothetical protein
MGLLRYSEGELRDLLKRAIKIRWPGEDLVIVTSCRAETPSTNVLGVPAADEQDLAQRRWAPTYAVLAATRSRLIYQERTTHAILLKAMAATLGVIAVLVLFFGSGLTSFAAIGLTGLGMWVVAKILELFTVGGTSIEFHRVEMMDRFTQRIDGAVNSGLTYRLRVPDPSDFGMICALVSSNGAAA